MIAHILIPLDGSHLAKAAVDVATQTVNSSCKITLVSAVQEPEYPTYPGNPMSINPEYYPTVEMLKKDAREYLEGVADLLRQRDYHVTTRVEVGEPADCILRAADDLHVDLIVMSTHGRSGVKRWLFGSVAQRVLNAAMHPVLVVPSRVVPEEIDQKATAFTSG